ncbi:MAG: cysteine hydrolase [Thermoleophilia bacterium]|nr:cysteine hydrolase [Thermoleophilia bacterium]
METTHAREAIEQLAKRPAVVTIDLHRGHLDPEVATLPLPAEASAALMERTVPLLDRFRAAGVPIIHVITSYRDRGEILSNPYWRFQSALENSPRSAIAEHNLDHLPGIELMPGIQGEGDAVVTTKKRYDCLLGTDLEITLESRGIDSLLIFGVNTNSCVIATTIAASVRDYAVFVVEEGVDTMLGDQLHDAASAVIGASFGWMVEGETALSVLESVPAAG